MLNRSHDDSDPTHEWQTRVRLRDGIELAVSVTGRGDALVMIPGLGATRSVYATLVDRLAPEHQVVTFDPRGVGQSEVPNGPCTMDILAADIADILDSLGIARAAVWGASMGGLVAQQFALDHPNRVGPLILAATGPGRAHGVAPSADVDRRLLGGGARTPAEAYRTACTVLYSHAFQQAHPEFIDREVDRRSRQPVSGRAFREHLAASRGANPWPRLAQITSPALVLHGSEDLVVPAANARLLAERIPGARLRWMDGAGHLFFHERPDDTARAVVDFLTEYR